MLYIIKEDNFLADYILGALEGRDDISLIRFERTKCRGVMKIPQLVIRFLRAIVINRKGMWNRWFFPDSFMRRLDVIGADDKVLMFSCQNLKELLVLDKEIACRSKSVFIWNPLSTINRNAYSRWEYAYKLHRTDMRVCTFDEGDAERYGFEPVKQVYRHPAERPVACAGVTGGLVSDVFYVGKDKKRSRVLLDIVTQLESQRLRCDFSILYDKHAKAVSELKSYYTNRLMAYGEYCDRALRSACMLEILQKGQTGMTMRTLEALFFNKKLITTNVAARQLPFYHPDNIYVLDGKERRTIRDFIYSGRPHYPWQNIKDYDIEHWICQFL